MDTSILILAGKYDIFSNLIQDSQRKRCKEDALNLVVTSETLMEFGGCTDTNRDTGLTLREFYSLVYSPKLIGKWFCVVDYESLGADALKILAKYMNKPSEYGVLVIRVKDFRMYRVFERDRRVKESTAINYINLSFPSRKVLNRIVTSLFESKGLVIEKDARDLFINKLSTGYDEYEGMAERFVDYKSELITYEIVAKILKGVENYILDDFMLELTKVVLKDKKTNRKIYKMVRSLLSDYSLKELLKRINRKAKDICEMRFYINKGYIPVGYPYSLAEVQSRVSEKSRLKNMSAYTFKKILNIAKRTSLEDWVYIVQLTNTLSLSSVDNMIILHALLHRDLYTGRELARTLDRGDN